MSVYELTTIHTGIDFGEGPRWHDRKLWFSDFFRRGEFAQRTIAAYKDHGTTKSATGSLPV